MSKRQGRSSGGRIDPRQILFFIIAAALLRTVFVFCCQKDNFHSDEIWSYGLANSYNQPFVFAEGGIYIDDITEDDYVNFNRWVPGSAMHDYITVQRGETFSYGSVYRNQTLDHHPPLYYILLHTVCSFFPDTFSPYFGFFLSCIFLIVTYIFLYRLSKRLFRSGDYALLVCAFYALGTGSLSTFIFLRQYSLLTMLTVMHLDCCAAFYYDKSPNLKRRLLPAALTAFAAFLTHYYAVVFIGVMTACICLRELLRRRYRQMLAYGGTLLLTLLLFFAVYPAVLMQVRHNAFSGTTHMEFSEQLRRFAVYIVRNNMGIPMHVIPSALPSILFAGLCCAVIICVPLCFLFRKEAWFASLRKRTAKGMRHLIRRIKAMVLRGDRFPLMLLLASIIMLLTVNRQVNIMQMGVFTQRYVFHLFPLASLMAVYAVRLLLGLLLKAKRYRKPASACVLALLAVNMHFMDPTPFTIDSTPRYPQICRDFADKNCLFVLSDTHSVILMTNFSLFTHRAANVMYTWFSEAEARREEVLRPDIAVDYVVISAVDYVLNDAQTAALEAIYGKSADEIVPQDFAALAQSEERTAELVRETAEWNAMFGEAALMPVYVMSVNEARFYVMKPVRLNK